MTTRHTLPALLAAVLSLVSAAAALTTSAGTAAAQPTRAPAVQPDPDEAASQATIRKLNAYVGLLNRTLRASDSLNRYESWVNMKTGPTGRERIIYGLYGLYDVRGEIEKASAATREPPAMPDLDAAIPAYVAAYQKLAPTITRAEGYYERQDYKVDKMAEGKSFHASLAGDGAAFLAERVKLEKLFAAEKTKADAVELALIERREGRKARWHVAQVMIRARPVIDMLPKPDKPTIDMAAFDSALASYGAAVREMDEFAAANPNSFFVFESQPRSLLGRLREFRDKIARAKGDARRGGGTDLTWIVNNYNSMVSSAQSATRFR